MSDPKRQASAVAVPPLSSSRTRGATGGSGHRTAPLRVANTVINSNNGTTARTRLSYKKIQTKYLSGIINKFVNSDGQWLLSFYEIVTQLLS